MGREEGSSVTTRKTEKNTIPEEPHLSKARDDDGSEEHYRGQEDRRRRHLRSPLPPGSISPPKKKSRMGQQPDKVNMFLRNAGESVVQVETPQQKVKRPGIPKETTKPELDFPNRFSPPSRPPDPDGFYRFRYGENISPRYKIISKLGEGTFGLVLECWDRIQKCFVAMKIIRKIEKYRAAAMVELEVLNTLKVNDPSGVHHCISIERWFNYRGHVCLVFEKMGPNLFHFLKKNNYNPFEIDIVRDIGYQLLRAVAYLHDLNLVHTDLKPENILFMRDGYERRSASPSSVSSGLRIPLDTKICLIDFGSATFEDGHHSRIVSTRHYRAPEVVIGAGWSFPCDLWSVGCVLVELITGETLFQTHEDMEHLAMMEQLLGSMPESLINSCDQPSRRLFRHGYELNWPEGASSRKSIRAVRRLLKLRKWIEEVGDKSIRFCLDDFVDFISQLLCYDPLKRITAKEALQHKFFKPLIKGHVDS